MQVAADAVTIDQVMPGERGLTAIPALRTALPSVALMMCTGEPYAEPREAALAAGADMFCKKAVDDLQLGLARLAGIARERAAPPSPDAVDDA